MGIKGLWKILDSQNIGRSVDMECLRDKRLAVDASIWLHQLIHSPGNPETNSGGYAQSQNESQTAFVLRVLLIRIGSLLQVGIRPIFVFDGRPPSAKNAIMGKRRARRDDTGEFRIKRVAQEYVARQLDFVDLGASSSTARKRKFKHGNGVDLDHAQPAARIKVAARPRDDFHVGYADVAEKAAQYEARGFDARFARRSDREWQIPLNNIFDHDSAMNFEIYVNLLNSTPIHERDRILSNIKQRMNSADFNHFLECWYASSRSTDSHFHEKLATADALTVSNMQIEGLVNRNAVTNIVGQASGRSHMVNSTNSVQHSRVPQNANSYKLTTNSQLKDSVGFSLSLQNESTSGQGTPAENTTIDLVSHSGTEDDELEDDDMEDVNEALYLREALNCPGFNSASPVPHVQDKSHDLSDTSQTYDENCTPTGTADTSTPWKPELTTAAGNSQQSLLTEMHYSPKTLQMAIDLFSSEEDIATMMTNEALAASPATMPTAEAPLTGSVDEAARKPSISTESDIPSCRLQDLLPKELSTVSPAMFYALWQHANPKIPSCVHEHFEDWESIVQKAVRCAEVSDIKQSSEHHQILAHECRVQYDSIEVTNPERQYLQNRFHCLQWYIETLAMILAWKETRQLARLPVYDDYADTSIVDLRAIDKFARELQNSRDTRRSSRNQRPIRTGRQQVATAHKPIQDERPTQTPRTYSAIVLSSGGEEIEDEVMDEGSAIPMSAEQPSARTIAYAAGKDSVAMDSDAVVVDHRFAESTVQLIGEGLSLARSREAAQNRISAEFQAHALAEVESLLRICGIPMIKSPGEAEAQCAELEQLGLCDGVITDDSDALAFGSRHVYRNYFKKQNAMSYVAEDIAAKLGYSQQQFVSFAYLLGGDYDAGVHGIGPKKAVQIMSEFPQGLDGLKSFRFWLEDGGILGGGEESAIRKKLRLALRHCELPDGFPNPIIEQHYLHPSVDSSNETITWGVVNEIELASFLARHGFHTDFISKHSKLLASMANIR